MSEQTGKVLHLPQKAKSGEFLRVRKNDRETIIYTLEVVEGETYLNSHTFIEHGGKLLPIEKASCTPLTFYPAALEHFKKMELEMQDIRQTFSAVERELLIKGLI
jgi:hypothetical protein